MDTLKHIVISLVISGLTIAGVVHFTEPDVQAPTLGALSSPDIASPYLSFGGVRRWAGSTTLTQGSATVCSIQSPAATSTLTSAGIRFDVASSSTLYVEMGKGATASATTTSLGVATIAGGAQDSMIASTSPAAGEATIFAPNQYFNVKIGFTGTATGQLPVGSCHAVWEEF